MNGCSRQEGQERFVLPERVSGVLLEKAATLEHPHHALCGGFGDSLNVHVRQGRCGHKDGGATGTFDKYAVGHQGVEVRVDVDGRAEALHECDRAAARILVAFFKCPMPVPRVDHPQEHRQHGAEQIPIPGQPEPRPTRKVS